MKKLALLMVMFILMISLTPFALAEDHIEEDDLEIFGLELEKLLHFGSGLLALALFVVTLMAYRRTGRIKLMYVAVAFGIFAVKGFLMGHELFMNEITNLETITSTLNFAILLAFFIGMVKK